MARKTSEDYKKTKQRLLEVGLTLFEEKGYNATGLQEIAAGAEISKGSFYSYFSSKANFGVGVIRYYTEISLNRWSSILEVAIKKEDARTALRLTFLQIIEKYEELDKKKGCLLGTLASEISEASEECRLELRTSVNRYKDVLDKYIAMGQLQGVLRDDVPSERLTELIWDCWQGSLLRMKIENSVKPVTNDLELLFNGILLPK